MATSISHKTAGQRLVILCPGSNEELVSRVGRLGIQLDEELSRWHVYCGPDFPTDGLSWLPKQVMVINGHSVAGLDGTQVIHLHTADFTPVAEDSILLENIDETVREIASRLADVVLK